MTKLFRLFPDRSYAFVLLGLMGCSTSVSEPTPELVGGPDTFRHPTTIVSSRELGTLEVRLGQTTTGVRCGVCHSIDADSAASRPEQLEEFHTEMEFGHGDLTCNACHHPEDRDLLRLADGRALQFEETMTLCAQCHGTQMRDYRRAAHGGMAGHWDLAAGPRTRNNCVNCHDPHAPQFPSMLPAPPPRDRLMPVKNGKDAHE